MTVEVPLSRGMVALVDDEDAAAALAAGPWSAFQGRHRTFYARRTVHLGTVNGVQRGTSLYLHQLLTGWTRTDHVNGDGLDCRRVNLRPASHADNMRNARRRVNNRSGYKGVSASGRRWRALITVDKRQVKLGSFDDPADAARAYDAAAREAFGEYARLNFPVVTS